MCACPEVMLRNKSVESTVSTIVMGRMIHRENFLTGRTVYNLPGEVNSNKRQ